MGNNVEYNAETKCCICSRPLGERLVEEHHLIPRTFKGRIQVPIHKMCHQKVHATFSERELANYYHTTPRLLEHEQIQKYVQWVQNKPLDFYDKNNDTKERKRRR